MSDLGARQVGDRLWLAPTATKIPPEARAAVVITGSHGGAYVGYLAARAGVAALVVHDAGVGLDQAGIGSLPWCERLGIAAVAVDHRSARIGDAADMLARGTLSHVNASAAALDCTPGMTCADAAEHLRGARPSASTVPSYAEARHVLGHNRHGLAIVCIDSVSLVAPEDAGQVVLSGSHGGAVAGQRGQPIKVAAAAAFFNDAGVGADDAGISRLAVLDELAIAGATVAATSARIGDGRSTLEDGLVSHVNDHARALGIVPGMRARDAVERVGPSSPC
ncbi:MAG: hypothetical protein H6982_02980 [Chromatiales bacterium]|nr:hypothetical protein [Chromatiales bacterium]